MRTAQASPTQDAPRSGSATSRIGQKIEGKKAALGTWYTARGIAQLNHVVRPMVPLWWSAPLVIALFWALIPFLRSKFQGKDWYQRVATVTFLHGPWWGPLGWLGIALLIWSLVGLKPAVAERWAPHAWVGLRLEFPGSWLVHVAWVGTAFAAFGVGMLLFRMQRAAVHAGEHGAAAWATWRDVIHEENARWRVPIEVHYRGTRRNWTLGDPGVGVAIWAPPEEAACTHFLLVGGTGAGKTTAVFGHVLHSSTVPVVYQDVKSECPCIDARPLALRWGAAVPGGWPSMCWNPLEEARRTKDPVERESAWQALAAMLLPERDEGSKDNAWIEEIGRPILAEGLQDGQYPTLGDFADAVRDRPLEELLRDMAVPRGLQSLLKGKNVPEYVAMSFYQHLHLYRQGWARTITSRHDFSLDDVLRRGAYVLSATGATEHLKAPVKLFWKMLFNRLMTTQGQYPLTILLDEAIAAGKIPNALDALVLFRSKKVSLWYGVQSEAHLDKLYGPVEGKALLNAFGNRIALLHGLPPHDAKAWSERLGTWTKRRMASRGAMGMAPQTVAVPLLTTSEFAVRGRRLHDRWAIFDCRESTVSAMPLVCRTQVAEEAIRFPSPKELAALLGPPAPKPAKKRRRESLKGDLSLERVPELEQPPLPGIEIL